jgi:2-haloacid dehalogenase
VGTKPAIRRKRRRTYLAALVLLLTFAVGIGVGIGLAKAFVEFARDSGRGDRHRGDRGRGVPDLDAPSSLSDRAAQRRVNGLQMAPYDGVLFDLFSGLLNSQPAYDEVAGSASLGSRWRREHSRLSYLAGDYRPHDDLVAEAAERIGLSPGRAPALVARLGELRPWPEAPAVLAQVCATVKIGVVTNCSDEVGRRAAAQVGVPFDVVATAEVAGAYKPRPEPYRLALEALHVNAARTLFVAGSPDDIAGATRVGMPVYWHNRRGADLGGRARPLVEHDSLAPLLDRLTAT